MTFVALDARTLSPVPLTLITPMTWSRHADRLLRTEAQGKAVPLP